MMCLAENTLSSHSHEPPSSHCRTPLHGSHECTVCVFQALEIPSVPNAVENVFSANDPPDAHILPSLLASLDTVRAVSTKIEQCIASMESVLFRMQSAKTTCAFSIKQHEAAIHPIRYIPDDILLNIFEWHTWSQTTRQGRAPWTLSHVSRRWRALLLSSPSLWSTIDIPCRVLKTDEDLQSLASKWDVVLKRSMDSYLFVRLVYHLDRVDKFVHLLPPTTARWKNLELSMRTPFPALLSHCDFDCLTKLVLFGNPRYTETVSMFTRAPNLSCLTLDGYVEIDVLWDRITSYTCTFHGARYLHRFSALEHLTLDFFRASGNMGSLFPSKVSVPLSLPTLRSLAMSHPTPTSPSIQDISKLLHVPSLTTLTISSGMNPLPIFAGPLPHLRELCLRSTAGPDDVFSFLEMHNSVTSLHVRTVEVLRVVVDRPILFPNLTILSVDADMLVRHPDSVIAVLEERCRNEDRPVARLLQLRISGTQKALREASAVYGIMERWNGVVGKVQVLEMQCSHCTVFAI